MSLLLLAKDSGFSEEKLSTFFSVVRVLHENTVQKDWDGAAAYSAPFPQCIIVTL